MHVTLPTMTEPTPRPPRAVVQTTVRIDPETYTASQQAAAREGVSLNEWIVRAMRQRLGVQDAH